MSHVGILLRANLYSISNCYPISVIDFTPIPNGVFLILLRSADLFLSLQSFAQKSISRYVISSLVQYLSILVPCLYSHNPYAFGVCYYCMVMCCDKFFICAT